MSLRIGHVGPWPLVAVEKNRMATLRLEIRVHLGNVGSNLSSITFLCELIQGFSFVHKNFKPDNTCSLYIMMGVLFPGHFIPTSGFDGFISFPGINRL